MWTIGIETSGREGSVALLRENDVVEERSLSRDGRRHAQSLVHELQSMLREAGVSPRACGLISVSFGPGSFTGLRVGVVCAKTWAYASGCSLVGVDTLHAVASTIEGAVERVDVVADAQRGDLFLGQYRREGDRQWTAESDVQIVSIEDWVRQLTGNRAVTGPAMERLRDRVALHAPVLPEASWHPSSVAVARIGRAMAGAGQTVDHWSLTPRYLRQSAAEEKADTLTQSTSASRRPAVAH